MKQGYIYLAAGLLALGLLGGCSAAKGSASGNSSPASSSQTASSAGSASQSEKITYEQITQEQAKELLDSEEDYILLDVRTQLEYDEGHIPGATLLPDYEVSEKAEELLPDKDQLILVYCRSGNRSKSASRTLAELGYTNVKEFGGIRDWPYEITTD